MKTFTGIAIAAKLQRKTLVVTHTLFLRAQWEDEVRKTLGIEPGLIGSGKSNTDSPIVIANIQTLIKHIDKYVNMFGTLLIDECHHTPASTFARIVGKCKAKYKIGLSGTLERKDGMHVLLQDFFSETRYVPPRENMMIPDIIRIPTEIPFSDNNELGWTQRVTDLLGNPTFVDLILNTVITQVARGHKVLVVSDRVGFLEYCHEILEDMSVIITGDTHDRMSVLARIDKDRDVIFATTSIFSEGISQNNLSCLILTTPTNNASLLEQLIGRIVRVMDGKMTPEVIDFLLQGATAHRQSHARLGLYIKKGYPIKEFTSIKQF